MVIMRKMLDIIQTVPLVCQTLHRYYLFVRRIINDAAVIWMFSGGMKLKKALLVPSPIPMGWSEKLLIARRTLWVVLDNLNLGR